MKRILCIALLAALLMGAKAEAAFVTRQRAWQTAENWLAKTEPAKEWREKREARIRELMHYQGGLHGKPGYYVAFLDPSGWLCIPADDRFEPVRAFGKEALTPSLYENSPFKFFLRLHLSADPRAFALSAKNHALASAQSKKRWGFLASQGHGNRAFTVQPGISMNAISDDVVVSPLLGDNAWGQGGLASNSGGSPVFYNKHVPWNGEPYLVGDLPLSLGQFLRSQSWGCSTSGTGQIQLNGVASAEPLLRTNGYNWNLMDLNPAPGNSEGQDEIATLLHDTGALLNANYTSSYRDGQTVYETFADLDRVPEALARLGYGNAIYAPYGFFFDPEAERRHLDRIVTPNLASGIPVFLGLSLFEGEPGTSSLLQKHVALIDGYAFQDYGPGNGRVPYHHINFGWNGANGDLWFALSDAVQLNASGLVTQAPYDFVFNVTSDDLGKELLGGRFYLGDFTSEDVAVTLTTPSGQTFSTKTDAKGVFWARVPSNIEIGRVGFKKGSLLNVASKPAQLLFFNGEEAQVGQSASWESVGNRWWGDISVKTALVNGIASGISDGLEAKNVLFASSYPRQMNEWSLGGLSGLYVSAFPYARYTTQPWLAPLFSKIEGFVRAGGTVLIEADSWMLASRLAAAAGGSLVFYSSSEVPVYQGAGLSKIFPRGELLEALRLNEVVIPFTPYEIGSGGPLIRTMTIQDGKLLAAAEIVLFTGGSASTRIYPVSVSFPLGAGKVYYASFPIPGPSSSASAKRLGDWYLSQPLTNAPVNANATTAPAPLPSGIDKNEKGEKTGGGCNGGMMSVLCLVFLPLSFRRKSWRGGR